MSEWPSTLNFILNYSDLQCIGKLVPHLPSFILSIIITIKPIKPLLDAPPHLYKRLCSSVGPSRVIFKSEKYAY